MSADETGESRPLRLLTFAPMIDSETARLVLAYYAVAYRESDHLFGWVSLLTLLHGGYGRVPLLHGRGLHLSGPHAIAGRFDPRLPPGRRLLPREQPLRTEVEADWQRYNGGLAGDVAALCYYHMLPERDVMTELFARSVPRGEARLVPVVYPALRGLFTILLRLDGARIDDALRRIRTAFDVTDRLIGDGRRFLHGDRLTLADLALAGATAPLLLPDHHVAPVPRLDQLPPALRAIVDELRRRPTAAFIGRLYATIDSRQSDAGTHNAV